MPSTVLYGVKGALFLAIGFGLLLMLDALYMSSSPPSVART